MNITQEAQDKAKRLLNRFVFFPFCIVFALLLTYGNHSAFKLSFFLMMLVYCLLIFCLPYFFIRSMIIKPVIKHYEKKLLKQYDIMQQQHESNLYYRDLNRDLDRKRQELEIEFQHLKRLVLLNSQADERKMQLIYQMERELQDRQNTDLDSLNAQIERMKREL